MRWTTVAHMSAVAGKTRPSSDIRDRSDRSFVQLGTQRVLVVPREARHQPLEVHRHVQCRLVNRQMFATGHDRPLKKIARLGAAPCRPHRVSGPAPLQSPSVHWTDGDRARPPNPRKRPEAPKPRSPEASTWTPSAHDRRRAQRQQDQRQRLWLRHSGGHIGVAHSHATESHALEDVELEARSGDKVRR